ncbi:MAG: ABC transporter substrate-binding protein [Acholeplasmataceae bacterium]|nr:ABC transporter substrate-binding protein [Acholeplasmataceae bacterium]
MKKVLFMLFAVLSVLVLVGCKDEGVTELQMLWWSDGTEGDVMQTLLDDYLEETGITIELVPIAYNDYEARLATMISGEEAPALARVTEGHLNNFKTQILPLDDVGSVKSLDFDLLSSYFYTLHFNKKRVVNPVL